MEKFRLVRPQIIHKEMALDYLEEFRKKQSEIHGVGGLDRFADDYEGWLEKLEEDRRREANEELVPAETFFLMKHDAALSHRLQVDAERLVGMINIRLKLNDALWYHGGHIGYSIRPSERRKGYNKVNLYLALNCVMMHRIEMALMSCDKFNIGSQKTIRALGGKLLHEYSYREDGNRSSIMQHYGIDVAEAVTKYAPIYGPIVAD